MAGILATNFRLEIDAQEVFRPVMDSPAVLEPIKPSPYHFTKENAREYNRKAIAAREAAKAAARLVAENYAGDRLKRVRAQLAKVDAMIEQEDDPQRLDRLASAQARLSVQEFALAGRPMPGSRRPGRESTKRTPGASGPSDVE